MAKRAHLIDITESFDSLTTFEVETIPWGDVTPGMIVCDEEGFALWEVDKTARGSHGEKAVMVWDSTAKRETYHRVAYRPTVMVPVAASVIV